METNTSRSRYNDTHGTSKKCQYNGIVIITEVHIKSRENIIMCFTINFKILLVNFHIRIQTNLFRFFKFLTY
jgi:hypothetical protein